MGTTGLIYVAIVAAWAAYLVPMWLRRHDEATRVKSVESPSSERRVLSRQTDDLDRARYVVRPQGAPAEAAAVEAAGPPPPRRSAASIRARRVAAMRRRRVLAMLTLSLLSLTALASFAIVPWWSLAAPGGLILSFLVVARRRVRKMERHHRRMADRAREAARARRAHVAGPPARVDVEPTIEVRLPIAPPVAEPVAPQPPAEGLWDPVPVTLPTYVHKEKAPDRTVRTVNLSGPEVFSSARTPDPVVAYEPVVPEPEQVVEETGEVEIRRAVGD